MTARPLLYLPVETKARELLGKSFLAARAVERGWIVVMGAHPDTRAFMLNHPPGVYVETSIPDVKAERLQRFHRDGHRIVNMCEEGVVYAEPKDYCRRKLGHTTLQLTDLLLVPGERNAEHVRTYRPEGESKIAITGNPRFDTLLPGMRRVYEREADTIRETFGRFIVVNTNFGRPNPFRRDADPVAVLISRGMLHEGEEADFMRRHVSFKRWQMQGLQDLLGELAASGSVDKIVVRPHPVENHDVWREWAKPLNIEIRFEGSANNWMLAADAVLHPGCTTGMEGLLLDRAVFSYVPDAGSEFIGEQDRASEWVTSASELSKGLERIRGLGQEGVRDSLAAQRARLGHSIANVQQPYAADRILDELEKLEIRPVQSAQIGLGSSFFAKAMRAGKKLLSPLTDAKRNERSIQKFPGLEQEEISEPLAQWADAGILAQVPHLTRLNPRLWALH